MKKAWLFSLLFLTCVSSQGPDSLVQTQYGPVKGITGDDFRAFRGIPYAAPPIGELRFQPPAPPKPWTEPLSTVNWAPSCPQNCNLPKFTCPIELDESCLFLNVFTPYPVAANNSSKLLPVMVFIHGGHYDQGGAGTELYDGPTFVSYTGVVLVSISYRLGALGFIVTKDLTGNYAILDQQFALRWVRDNIKAFGGDPSQVTIFGESAGGTSVRAHLISPLSKGLFHKAILQSDPMAIPFQTREASIAYSEHFIKNLGCDGTPGHYCLFEQEVMARNHCSTRGTFIRVDNIIQATLPWAPISDDEVLPYRTPFDAIADRKWNAVPILIGADQRDARIFIWEAFKNTLPDWKYVLSVTAIFFPSFKEILAHYPAVSGIDLRPTLGKLVNDYLFACTARHLIDLSKQVYPEMPVYLYRWNHSLSWDGWGPDYAECVDYPCHGSELVYEFDAPFRKKLIDWLPEEGVLSRSIMDYWSNFAKTGNPSLGDRSPAVNWPQWEKEQQISLILQTPNTLAHHLSSADCDFWDKLGYTFAYNSTSK